MTEEEAREELRQYRYDKAIERRRLEMLEELKNDCMKMTSVLTDMPQSPTHNVHKVEEKYIRYLDMQNEVLELMNKNMSKTLQVTKKIQRMEQPFKGIIEARYILGQRTWEIADNYRFSIRTMNRMLNEAIKIYANL